MTASFRSAAPAPPAAANTAFAEALAWLARSNLRAVCFLILISLLAFLPGIFNIPPVDRDEVRVAQASKQMMETGNYVDLRFQDETRYQKPVGIEWLQVATVRAAEAAGLSSAPARIWLYRMPSLLGAIGGVLLTYWMALAFVSRRSAMLAAAMMAASILLGVEARLAKSEAVLFFTCVTAMAAMARAYLAQADAAARPDAIAPLSRMRSWLLPALFWSALAAGIMVKGLLILLFVVVATLTLAVCDRSVRWIARLKPLPGIVWMLLLLTPWFVAVSFTSEVDFNASMILRDFARDMVGRIVGTEDIHRAWPGFYVLLFWVTFFPASVLAGLSAPFVWHARREPRVHFLLAWLIPSWIVFELVMTKVPSYVLPLYPAVAVLLALAVDRDALSRAAWLVRHTVWWFVVPSLAIVIGIGGAMIIGRQLAIAAWPFAAGIITLGFLTWRLYEQDGSERSFWRGAAASILLAATFYGILVPSLPAIFPSVTMAQTMRQTVCRDPVAAVVGYGEPSIVFLAGTSTVFTGAAEAAEFLGRGNCRFVFIDTRYERGFAQRADAIGLRYASGPRFEAFNFGAGRAVTIAVYTSDITQ